MLSISSLDHKKVKIPADDATVDALLQKKLYDGKFPGAPVR